MAFSGNWVSSNRCSASLFSAARRPAASSISTTSEVTVFGAFWELGDWGSFRVLEFRGGFGGGVSSSVFWLTSF